MCTHHIFYLNIGGFKLRINPNGLLLLCITLRQLYLHAVYARDASEVICLAVYGSQLTEVSECACVCGVRSVPTIFEWEFYSSPRMNKYIMVHRRILGFLLKKPATWTFIIHNTHWYKIYSAQLSFNSTRNSNDYHNLIIT